MIFINNNNNNNNSSDDDDGDDDDDISSSSSILLLLSLKGICCRSITTYKVRRQHLLLRGYILALLKVA